MFISMVARGHRFHIAVAILVFFGLHVQPGRCQTPVQREEAKWKVAAFMRELSERGQFSGAALVGNGEGILYEEAFGQANRTNAKPFTIETQSCVGSVSKPFTAVAVMMQVRNGSMRLDDPVSNYVDGLRKVVGAVTIRQLLTHTSGIPDYGNTPVDHPGTTTEEVLNSLRTLDHLEFAPGDRYQYSNSGYVLLGAAVAKAAKMSFPQFLETHILAPAGMKRTFLFTREGQKTSATAIAFNDFGDVDDYAGFTTGDGGLYSTVEDLYHFDQALYSNTLLPRTMLEEMFTPATVRTGTTTYGLGWNVQVTTSGKRVWHTGNTAGFRAYIERQLATHRVIVLLTNEGNSNRIEISSAINNILDGRPFTYPKRSGAVQLYRVYRAFGIAAVLSEFRTLKESSDQQYDLSETEINGLGYRVLSTDHNATDAVRLFMLNADEHPSSSNAFDSLAEAYQKLGDPNAAKQAYQRAVELDPTNEHAKTALSYIK